MAKDRETTITGKDVKVEYDKDPFSDGGCWNPFYYRSVDVTDKQTGETVRGTGDNRKEAERNAIEKFKNK